MKNVAWVTCRKYVNLIESEQLVVKQLVSNGLNVEPVVWDDDHVNWGDYDLILVRTIWDYHLKINQFIDWTSKLDSEAFKVFNPPSVLRWNHHKFYLQDLAEKGVPIVPSKFHKKEQVSELNDIINDSSWDQLILKPAVSATAHGLIKLDKSELEENAERIIHLVNHNDIIIQEFKPEISLVGEWSLMYFNKQFSHAVLKFPKDGDFRVQNDFGGSHELVQPDENLLSQVNAILHTIDEDVLFCRVDGIVLEDQFVLMELELIEPELFLINEEIKNNFVRAIQLHL